MHSHAYTHTMTFIFVDYTCTVYRASLLTAISNTFLRSEYRCIQMMSLKVVKSKLSPPLEASSLKCALSASADPPQVIL